MSPTYPVWWNLFESANYQPSEEPKSLYEGNLIQWRLSRVWGLILAPMDDWRSSKRIPDWRLPWPVIMRPCLQKQGIIQRPKGARCTASPFRIRYRVPFKNQFCLGQGRSGMSYRTTDPVCFAQLAFTIIAYVFQSNVLATVMYGRFHPWGTPCCCQIQGQRAHQKASIMPQDGLWSSDSLLCCYSFFKFSNLFILSFKLGFTKWAWYR